jgi:hypothetical protein
MNKHPNSELFHIVAGSHVVDTNKTELLRVIRKAKSSHIRWRSYAQALLAGLDVPADSAPVSHHHCAFGKWYYGDGVRLLGHLDIYDDIAVPHEILHQIYGRIHDLAGSGRMDEARPLLDQLIGVSRTLLDSIQLLEQEVAALSDTALAAA